MSTVGNVRAAVLTGALSGLALTTLLVGTVHAQDVPANAWPDQGSGNPAYQQQPVADGWDNQPASDDPNAGAPLIPPNVEGPAYPAANGSYCYVGPHPVDTRVAPGPSWDDTQGQHYRAYAPIDTRLYSFRDGCYYFTGDPRDFGYGGQTYAYYGAHPLLDAYGGGWCFMMGPHNHIWQPWSPHFTVVGSWYYWHGPYDPFFWSYWPYYSFYYRSYYPSYYGGGRFYRGGGYRMAPAIRPVQVQAWRGASSRGAAVYRGTPPAQSIRSNPTMPTPGVHRGFAPPGASPGFRPNSPTPGGPGTFRGEGATGTPSPGFHPNMNPGHRGVNPSYPPATPSYQPMGPGSRPSFSPPGRSFSPSFSPSPGRSFSPSPGGRSFSPPGGGMRGGGSFSGGGMRGGGRR